MVSGDVATENLSTGPCGSFYGTPGVSSNQVCQKKKKKKGSFLDPPLHGHQSFDLRSSSAVAMASFSKNSINRLTTMANTGLPMAAPKICL